MKIIKPLWTCLRRYSSTTSYNRNYDVVLVGGGVMGLSSAYFLAKKIDPSSICVIERDRNYVQNSAVLSWGSIRQQFSVAENIRMSQFGFRFLQDVNEYLGISGEGAIDLQFKHGTYCFLASETGKATLEENAVIQRAENVPISLLSKNDVTEKYPWMNTDGVVLASNVSFGEGWFDPWSLLSNLKRKVCDMGVHFIQGEMKAIDQDAHGQISGVKISSTSTNLEKLTCGNLVNAAGAWGQDMAQMVGIDLPVEPTKRVTFVVHCPDGFLDPILLVDGPQNIFLRPEGYKQYIIGAPSYEDDFATDENHLVNIDYDYFYNDTWPKLAHRIPAFENLKVTNAWAGYYDYNIMDQNGIISGHPHIKNLFFANGFSGHGIQQAPAVGRAISELVVDGDFKTIDLSTFSYERFYNKQYIREKNVI